MTKPPRFSLPRSAPSRLLLHYLRGVLSQHVELVSDDLAGVRPGVGLQSPLLHQVRQRRRVPVPHRANPDAFGGHVWAGAPGQSGLLGLFSSCTAFTPSRSCPARRLVVRSSVTLNLLPALLVLRGQAYPAH